MIVARRLALVVLCLLFAQNGRADIPANPPPPLPQTWTAVRKAITGVQIIRIRVALYQFRRDNGQFPKNGLDELLFAPQPLAATWRGPYLQEMPRDGWGEEFLYRFPATCGGPFDLISTLGVRLISSD